MQALRHISGFDKVRACLVRIWLCALLAISGHALLLPDAAHAQSATCIRIESKLATLESNNAYGRSDYRSAIRRQKSHISQLERQMRSYRCDTGGHRSCRRMARTLKKMNRNLRSLQNRYDRSGRASAGSSAQRKRLQREYRRNRCGQADRRVASVKRQNFFERLFSGNRARQQRQEDVRKSSGEILDEVFGSNADAERRRQARLDRRELRRRQLNRQLWSTKKSSNSNKFRTVCVRRCDGYYFPVSHATDESGFGQDAMACNLMCPGTQMELFSHKTDTETPEDMVSTIDGTLYTSMKTAFSHRDKYDPKCACNFKLVKRSYNIDIPDSVRLAELTNTFFEEKKTALPSWRKDGTLSKKPAPADQPASTQTAPPNDRKDGQRRGPIRVIGDAFFPTR